MFKLGTYLYGEIIILEKYRTKKIKFFLNSRLSISTVGANSTQ